VPWLPTSALFHISKRYRSDCEKSIKAKLGNPDEAELLYAKAALELLNEVLSLEGATIPDG
jgi:hypothetical protein